MKNNLNFQLKNYCNYSTFIWFSKISSHDNKLTKITLSAKIGKLEEGINSPGNIAKRITTLIYIEQNT